MIVVGQPFKFPRYIRRTCTDNLGRQIRRCEPKEECKPHSRCTHRCKQRIGNSVCKDSSRIPLCSKCRKCRNHSKRNGRHGNELEQAREYRRNKVKQLIQYRYIHPTKYAANDERTDPKHNLPLLIVQFRRRKRRLCFLLHIIVYRRNILLFCHI